MRRPGSECLELIRHKDRPGIMEYLPLVFDDSFELYGDRAYGDDSAVWGGLAMLDGHPVTVIGTRKGHNLQQNQQCNFCMPHPEGYRKAQRLMQQAAKFKRPVICFVDTPGAYCGVEAEERGQGQVIARSIADMLGLETPTITIITGEGGSGGALALSAADRVAMLSNAIYSVISPRGFASLVYKDPSRELEAADKSRITAFDLREFGICDQIIAEPGEGAHEHTEAIASAIRSYLLRELGTLSSLSAADLLETRLARYRSIGSFYEPV